MALAIAHSIKPNNNCRILLVKNKSDFKKFNLSKENIAYFNKQFNDKSSAAINNAGNHIAFCKVEAIKSPQDREKIRLFGHQMYEQYAKEVAQLSVESEINEATQLFLEGAMLSSYKFDKYLKEKSKPALKKISYTDKSVKQKELKAVTEAVFWARDMVNEPVSFMTATQLGKEFRTKLSKAGVKVEVMKKAKIESLKMGGLLAVNKGSIDPPTFSVMQWKPKNPVNKQPIVLIGKGIVYDTGGLSLKPTANSMDLMKSDMGGAAAVAAATLAVAKLNLPLHIITLVPSTDNRPGGNAYAPGDIVKMFNGMTVEIKNTDAEGRMALADALAYSNKFKPELVVDAATLTGAAARAIGKYASCVMGNANQRELDKLIAAGDHTYDRVVQFPFWDEYGEEMKSPIADLKNLGSGEAGMITAGKFLENFTDYPYIHMDIAGPTFMTSKEKYRGLGATGAGVRLLVEFLKRKAGK